jgi:hypothetical protein
MKALIFNNTVVQLSETSFEVNDSLYWMDASDEVQLGWLVEDGVLVDSDKRTPQQKAEDNLKRLRERRNVKLQQTDWWANSDLVMTDAQKAYRQALRDITDEYTSILDVVWPTKPV